MILNLVWGVLGVVLAVIVALFVLAALVQILVLGAWVLLSITQGVLAVPGALRRLLRQPFAARESPNEKAASHE